MGPEAGEGGGKIVVQGTPAQVARKKKESHTGRVLEAFLRDRTRPADPVAMRAPAVAIKAVRPKVAARRSLLPASRRKA
jgi:hypothetical protein